MTKGGKKNQAQFTGPPKRENNKSMIQLWLRVNMQRSERMEANEEKVSQGNTEKSRKSEFH